MIKLFHYLFFGLLCVIVACNDTKKKRVIPEKEFISSIPEIKTSLVKESFFQININSNGKLEAKQKVDLKFENEGLIKKILVHDGDLIKKGQTIAYQTSNYLLSEKKMNEEVLNKALLNMEDVLLGFGYSLNDTIKIPKDIMNMAKSRSGIEQAKNQIIQTQKKHSSAKITAPFSGVIANLSAKENSLSSMSDKLCTLINNKILLASFYILENEFGIIAVGDLIEIYPIALPTKKFTGKVKYINPIINENGLILIKAIVDNKESLLIDGMSVNISIQKKIGNVISVPKKALVDRQDKKVIFTYNNGKSKWNYVETSYETRDSIIIIKGIKVGDSIITDGNVNLAHDTEVIIK